jgi:hypothetical protein
VLDFVGAEGGVTRERLFDHFRKDAPEDVAAVLKDLVGQGIVYATGRGPSSAYGLSSEEDRRRVLTGSRREAASVFVWMSLYRQPMTRDELHASLALDEDDVERALEELEREGRIREERGKRRADTFVIPVGAARGWEVAASIISAPSRARSRPR